MTYRLIPLDDAIVFPTVTATLPIDVGDEERVFLLPRRDGEFGRVGVVAEVIEHGVSRRGSPVATVRRPAPRARRRRPVAGDGRPRARCASRCRRSTTATPTTSTPASWPASTAPWSRRSSSCAATTAASPPSCARSRSPARWPTPPASAPTSPTSGSCACSTRSTSPQRLEIAVELQRERLAELQVRSRDPRRRRVRRPETAARVLPAQTDGVDPQGAGRGRGRPDRRVRDARSPRPGCRRRSPSRPRRSCAGSSARASSRPSPR